MSKAAFGKGLAASFMPAADGLPFLGDNAFLPDRIELLDTPPPAHWYERVTTDGAHHPSTNHPAHRMDRPGRYVAYGVALVRSDGNIF